MRAINDTHAAATQLRPDVVSVGKPLPDHLPSMKKQANSCKSKWRVCGMRKASAVKALGSTDPNGYESCNDRPRLYGMYSSAPDRTRNDPRNHTKSHEQRLLCFVYLVDRLTCQGSLSKSEPHRTLMTALQSFWICIRICLYYSRRFTGSGRI